MYCEECGRPVQTKYCRNCGTRSRIDEPADRVADIARGDCGSGTSEVDFGGCVDAPSPAPVLSRMQQVTSPRSARDEGGTFLQGPLSRSRSITGLDTRGRHATVEMTGSSLAPSRPPGLDGSKSISYLERYGLVKIHGRWKVAGYSWSCTDGSSGSVLADAARCSRTATERQDLARHSLWRVGCGDNMRDRYCYLPSGRSVIYPYADIGPEARLLPDNTASADERRRSDQREE